MTQWIPIPGHEDYEVSNTGEVRDVRGIKVSPRAANVVNIEVAG